MSIECFYFFMFFFFIIIILNLFRPTGVVGRGAAWYIEGTGLESRVRHGCKTVRPFIRGNGDRLSGALIIKWSPVLALVVGQGLSVRLSSHDSLTYITMVNMSTFWNFQIFVVSFWISSEDIHYIHFFCKRSLEDILKLTSKGSSTDVNTQGTTAVSGFNFSFTALKPSQQIPFSGKPLRKYQRANHMWIKIFGILQ